MEGLFISRIPVNFMFMLLVVGLWWVTHRRQCDKRACVALDIGSESWALLDVGVGNDKVESGPREWWERKFKIAIFLFQKKLMQNSKIKLKLKH